MTTHPGDQPADWDAQAVRDIIAAGYADAVILTDRNGRILHSELRRETPEPLGVLVDLAIEAHTATGQRFGLGGLHMAASMHDAGAIVCGRTEQNSIVILASERANLGQLLRHVRRVFPQRFML